MNALFGKKTINIISMGRTGWSEEKIQLPEDQAEVALGRHSCLLLLPGKLAAEQLRD